MKIANPKKFIFRAVPLLVVVLLSGFFALKAFASIMPQPVPLDEVGAAEYLETNFGYTVEEVAVSYDNQSNRVYVVSTTGGNFVVFQDNGGEQETHARELVQDNQDGKQTKDEINDKKYFDALASHAQVTK
jgi:hypothetical protein